MHVLLITHCDVLVPYWKLYGMSCISIHCPGWDSHMYTCWFTVCSFGDASSWTQHGIYFSSYYPHSIVFSSQLVTEICLIIQSSGVKTVCSVECWGSMGYIQRFCKHIFLCNRTGKHNFDNLNLQFLFFFSSLCIINAAFVFSVLQQL